MRLRLRWMRWVVLPAVVLMLMLSITTGLGTPTASAQCTWYYPGSAYGMGCYGGSYSYAGYPYYGYGYGYSYPYSGYYGGYYPSYYSSYYSYPMYYGGYYGGYPYGYSYPYYGY